MLLEARCDVNAKDNEGLTPIMISILRGYFDGVDLLIKHRGIEIDKQDNQGKTSYHHTCILGNDDILKLLLSVSVYQIMKNIFIYFFY